jgi:hypothetical protein
MVSRRTTVKSHERKLSFNLRPNLFIRFEALRGRRKYIAKTAWLEAAIGHYLDLVERYGFSEDTLRPKVMICTEHSAGKSSPSLKPHA